MVFTFESFALGHSDAIYHLVLSKDLLDRNFLLEVFASKVDLVGDGSTVQLDLHNVRLLLATTKQFLLRVADHADHLAVLLHLGQIFLDLLLSGIVLPLLAGLGERLLLRLRPVLEREAVTQTKNRGEGGERKKMKSISTRKKPWMLHHNP